jgi:dTDP-4-amino-4,6-dideoxygalactose transaminase
MLDVKLKYIDEENCYRREIANQFNGAIVNEAIVLPDYPLNEKEHVWHLYVVRTKERERLRRWFNENDIETLIHYPIPPHKQEAYKEWNTLSFPITEQIHNEVLSLPISPLLTSYQVNRIVEVANAFESGTRVQE